MSQHVPYDNLAEIYDLWVENYGPVMEQSRAFYSRRYVDTPGPVVELGVGNGRILIAAALAGKRVIGVDSSTKMLALCRRKAIEAGVEDRIELVQADFRRFQLAEPAELIAIPYDSIGHLVDAADKRACFEQVASQLAPGGRLIFDHRVHDPVSAAINDRKARLQLVYEDEETGREVMLWLVTLYDFDRRTNHTYTWTETVELDGHMTRRMLGSVENSWLDAEAMRELIAGADFEIEDCLGDFDGGPFSASSHQHIWIARRPGG